jgi:ankyrin repeat protein
MNSSCLLLFIGKLMTAAINFTIADFVHAVKNGDHDFVRSFIVAKGPEMAHYQLDDSCTLLHLAVSYKDIQMLKLLVTLGNMTSEDIDKTDCNGYTPLHYATRHNSPEIIEKLLKFGSKALNTGTKYNPGCTPIYLASRFGCAENIKMLYRFGSTGLNKTDILGMYPIHGEAASHNLDAIKTIIRLDSTNINSLDREKKTPLDAAISCLWVYNNEVIRMLLAIGCVCNNQKLSKKFILTEDQVWHIRYDTYFSNSLVNLLVTCYL